MQWEIQTQDWVWFAYWPDVADLPPPLVLSLWLKVLLRGDICNDDRFVAWDQPTWERQRLELARVAKPMGVIPFPGRVGHPLYWLEKEYEVVQHLYRSRWPHRYGDTQPKALSMADELLCRAESLGDAAEIAHWRAERAKYGREPAPPPRAAVK